MNGRFWKEWKKRGGRTSHEDWERAKLCWSFDKPVRRALKFAKKVLKEMQKGDPDSECGLWYDMNDGCGYRECCRSRKVRSQLCVYEGRTHSIEDCPYELAKRLVSILGGD